MSLIWVFLLLLLLVVFLAISHRISAVPQEVCVCL